MSNASEGQIILPNPFTPMAFLPPDLAFQSAIKTYVAVGTTAVSLTVQIFEMLLSLLITLLGADLGHLEPPLR